VAQEVELADILPHRPPMIWIDHVEEFSAMAGRCRVRLDSNAAYMGPSGLHSFAAIELIAQGYGFARGKFLGSTGPTSPKLGSAYLVGVRDFQITQPIPAAHELIIDVRLVREMAPLALVEGVIKNERDETMARGLIKVYFETVS
jgi:predicted hotdog family 3-hydroxylacyl-ACP dehydratase